MNYIPVHRLANKLGIAAAKIYTAIREHRLKEGRDYIRTRKEVIRIEVREDLEI